VLSITRSFIITLLPSAYIETKGAWFAWGSTEERKALHSHKKSSWHIGNSYFYLWIKKRKMSFQLFLGFYH
jgi:hypothetical protein